MNNPGDERTREILEKYGIRYIVLCKNFPGRPPARYLRLFRPYPNLYQTAFHNHDVVILEPLQTPRASATAFPFSETPYTIPAWAG